MIYLVSNNIDCSNFDGISKLSIQESLEMISKWPVVQFDTETTGLNPRICTLRSLQFGYKDFATGEHLEIVVDCSTINPKIYKNVIENSYIIGQNLKFDLKFLFNHNIVPLNIYDTMICEQTLYLGYDFRTISFSLGEIVRRYLGIDIDKSFQKSIATEGLTEEGIRYSANDVVYLQDIRKSQMQVAQARKCVNAFVVENRFVPAIAYLEWCGVKLDVDKWTTKMTEDSKKLEECKNALNSYVVNHKDLSTEFVSTYYEPSLFDTSDTSYDPYCTINWGSSQQVAPVFKMLGFNTTVIDKTTKKEKDSVEEKVLSVQKGINDEFLNMYFEYKAQEKLVSTYGQGFINLINPNTGRLHTEFQQLGTVTGRMSSGKGIKSSGIDYELAKLKNLPAKEVKAVNLQNLPSRGDAGKVTRACFVSSPTTTFVSCDYSAEESRVQADVWEEKSLMDSFENGIDTHNLYAKMCFPDELKDVDVRDVQKVRPDLRQKAKSAEFAVGYGSDGSSIAATIGVPVDKAREMVQGILKGMPGMAAFKKKTANFLKEHGYIIINTTTGHRVYWPEWSTWKATQDRFDKKFWEEYNLYHKGTNDSVAAMVRKHISSGHDWFEKNVLNYPIQGGSAIVLKQAAADLFKWIVDNGYFNKILFCVFVHDEIDCECPNDILPKFSKVIKSIMENAAAKFYKKLPIPAEISCGDHWIH